MRNLGAATIAPLGLGCMGFNHIYGEPISQNAAHALVHRAIDRGVTHFDTAALYGGGLNEQWVGEALRPHRGRVHLASKCGISIVDGKRVVDGRPEALRRTCEDSLRRLQTDVIDLYYLHRWDKRIAIEESVGELARFVAEGKVRGIGLSEVSAATLRRAQAVHPIAAMQVEYSLWTRNPEIALVDACADLGTTLVAFSPLGRGFLAGAISATTTYSEGDIRRGMPRFREPHLSKNLQLLQSLRGIAAENRCTTGQLALAWLLRKSKNVVPIPGTTSLAHLEENLGALQVTLSGATFAALDRLINQSTVSGARYPPEAQAGVDTEEFTT